MRKNGKNKRPPIRYLLLSGVFTNESHGVIVGAGGSVLFTEDAGATWNQSTVFGESKAKLNAVFFINQKTGWTAGEKGKIFHTINGGKTWREQNSGTLKDFNRRFFYERGRRLGDW